MWKRERERISGNSIEKDLSSRLERLFIQTPTLEKLFYHEERKEWQRFSIQTCELSVIEIHTEGYTLCSDTK